MQSEIFSGDYYKSGKRWLSFRHNSQKGRFLAHIVLFGFTCTDINCKYIFKRWVCLHLCQCAFSKTCLTVRKDKSNFLKIHSFYMREDSCELRVLSHCKLTKKLKKSPQKNSSSFSTWRIFSTSTKNQRNSDSPRTNHDFISLIVFLYIYFSCEYILM